MSGHIITVSQQKGGSGKTTLSANLAIAFRKRKLKVALLDTDPQGSLGRWFMTRLEALPEDPDLSFATASAWGVSYETSKLARDNDIVIIDTPPKADSDLRPALRAATLALIPVAQSQMDLWATENVLDLARREKTEPLIVLNRMRAKSKLAAEIAESAKEFEISVAKTHLGHRQAYAESIGSGRTVMDGGSSPAKAEVEKLTKEVLSYLKAIKK